MFSSCKMEDTTANNASTGFQIPRYDQLRQSYDMKWLEEKEKFNNQLKENFQALTAQFRTGRQVIYELAETPMAEQYIKAFRELFADTGYQATVGEMERLGTGAKKSRKLIIRLPGQFNGTV